MVCTIILNFSNFYWYKKIGALTSKPFAYKAWSWELTTSYIANITNITAEKLRVDSKGLEIVWILPWLNTSLSENWIDDKSRFFYDGLSLNRITKFFIKRKFFFLPVIFLILHVNDPLFFKYILITNKFKFLKNISTFKNLKQNIITLFFELFYLFSLYNNLFINNNFTNLLNDKNKIFFSKSWLNRIFLLGNFKFLKKKIHPFINEFFFSRKTFTNKFEKFININLNKFSLNFFLNILNINTFKKLNFFLNTDTDILNLSLIEKLNKKNIQLFFPIKNLSFFLIKQNKFNYLFDNSTLSKINLIFLINTNIRLTNPKLHLFFKKIAKINENLFISIGNYDEMLFQHINFGSTTKNLNFILNAKHWISSFFKKKLNVGFFLNIDNNQVYLNTIKYFFLNLNLKKNSILKNKTYDFPIFYYYYTGYNTISNQYSLLYCLNLEKFSLIKKNFNLMNNNIKSHYYLSTSALNTKTSFIFNVLNKKLKINYHLLLESNLQNYVLSSKWDFILPLTIITENFFQIKNLKNSLTKSLFIKYGPWYAWSLFTYINFFILLTKFPYFWLNSIILNFLDLSFLFLNFWLFGLLENFKNFFFSSIKTLKLNSFTLKLFLHKKLKIFYVNFFNIKNWNFWTNTLSYIANSRYTNMGSSLLYKEFKTFLS